MAKKKKNTKKKSSNPVHLIILALIIAVVVLVVLLTNQSQTTSSKSTDASLRNPAVAEAKAVADKYFEAASRCDVETANSLRLLPKKDVVGANEKCEKECPGGLKYKYIKPDGYTSKESGGITTEIALFDYAFGCGDKAYPTVVQMIRSSDDRTWLVFNTY